MFLICSLQPLRDPFHVWYHHVRFFGFLLSVLTILSIILLLPPLNLEELWLLKVGPEGGGTAWNETYLAATSSLLKEMRGP